MKKILLCEPNISETVSFGCIGKSRACAAKADRLTQGDLEFGSGSRLYAESQSLEAQAIWQFQKSAKAILLTAICHWRQEGPNREEQGGVTDKLGPRTLLRLE